MSRVTTSTLQDVKINGTVVTAVDVSDIDSLMKLAGLSNTITLFNDKAVYYAPDGGSVTFGSLKEALSQVTSFDGTVRLVEDVESESRITLENRRMTIDLNGFTLSNRGTDSSDYVFWLSDGSVLTVRNGKMSFTGEGVKFHVGYATLTFDDVDVDIDYSLNTGVWNTDLITCSHQYGESRLDEGKSVVNIGRNASIRMHDARLGETLITMFSMYWALKKAGVVSNKDQYISYLGGRDLETELNIDGRITVDRSGTEQYPTITTGNGSDIGRMNITVGETAVIKTDIVGLYSGNDIRIILNGGKIIAKTGIIMRGGSLVVPEGAEPTVIGTGEYRPYDPAHTVKEGSDHSMNLGLGHAVCLENNGLSYGQSPVSADIRSGTFISYNNTPIGYYGIGVLATDTSYTDQEEPGVSASFDINGVMKTCHFMKRTSKVGFLKFGQLNRYSTEDDDARRYDFATGKYPAAGIVAEGSSVNGFGNVCVDEPYCS